MGGLPLNTVEDFVYLQHAMWVEFRILFPVGAGKINRKGAKDTKDAKELKRRKSRGLGLSGAPSL